MGFEPSRVLQDGYLWKRNGDLEKWKVLSKSHGDHVKDVLAAPMVSSPFGPSTCDVLVTPLEMPLKSQASQSSEGPMCKSENGEGGA